MISMMPAVFLSSGPKTLQYHVTQKNTCNLEKHASVEWLLEHKPAVEKAPVEKLNPQRSVSTIV